MRQSTALDELKIAQQKLHRHHEELEKCAHDLEIANSKLDAGNCEKIKRADEVNTDLENMMFTVSHEIRNSVANILGISKLLCEDKDIALDEMKEMLHIIIHSAESLNVTTEKLCRFIHLKKCSSND